MPLPALVDWDATHTGLHQAAQVIGGVRAAIAAPEPNYTHLGLHVVPGGLSSGALPDVGEFALDFGSASILYTRPGHEPVGFALAQHTQQTLADAVDAALAEYGYAVAVNRDKLHGAGLLRVDPAAGAAYAEALTRIHTVFDRFRTSLPGQKSPLIVWPHGFDLSFLWFATAEASEAAPHLAFGFSPGSAGLDAPYIYVYSHPIPPHLTTLKLPDDARWHTDDWAGAVLDYAHLAAQPEPDTLLRGFLARLHDLLKPHITPG